MLTRLEGYIFVQDAFGILPVWSLQHPKKGAKDSYRIINYINKDRPNWLKTLIKLSRMRCKVENFIGTMPNDIVDVYICGKIRYSRHLDERYIDDLEIDYWSIEGTI